MVSLSLAAHFLSRQSLLLIAPLVSPRRRNKLVGLEKYSPWRATKIPRPAKGENSSPGARLGKSSRSDLVEDRDPVEEEDSSLDNSSPGADEKVLVPDECSTKGEKIAFLRSLVVTDGQTYQVIVSSVVQLRVSFHFVASL